MNEGSNFRSEKWACSLRDSEHSTLANHAFPRLPSPHHHLMLHPLAVITGRMQRVSIAYNTNCSLSAATASAFTIVLKQ